MPGLSLSVHCPHAAGEQGQKGAEGQSKGRPSDLGLSTCLPSAACVQRRGITDIFSEHKCNYECLKNKSGNQGNKKNSNIDGVGDFAPSPT